VPRASASAGVEAWGSLQDAPAAASAAGPTGGGGGGSRLTQARLQLPDVHAVLLNAATARETYCPSGSAGAVRGRIGSPIATAPAAAARGGKDSPATVQLGDSAVAVLSSLHAAPEYITAADFVCGGLVSLYGKPFLLRSCDATTVAFCLRHMGFDQRETFVRDTEVETPTPRLPLAPHVGVAAVGTEAETRANAQRLTPVPRLMQDYGRFTQLEGKALRFAAAFDPACVDPEDAPRRFVVSFFLADGALQIGELTGTQTGRGPAVVRYLARGKYRNPLGGADPEEAAAMQTQQGAMPRAALAAYDRVFGAAKDKIGYTDVSGGAQGYSGGVFGKAERVNAGGMGVETALGGFGLRDASLHSTAAPPRFFDLPDFQPGARIALPHAPHIVFVLGQPDAFTGAFLQSVAEAPADASVDPRDVFVPDSAIAGSAAGPDVRMPLEAMAPSAAAARPLDAGASTLSERDAALEAPRLLMARVLAGVMASVRTRLRQSDRLDRGFAPRDIVASVLASYGAQAPACPPEVLDFLLDAHALGPDALAAARAADAAGTHVAEISRIQSAAVKSSPGARPAPVRDAATATPPRVGAGRSLLSGPVLRDFASPQFGGVPLVAYHALLDGVKEAAERQAALQPRLEKLMSQLRGAILSSREHARRVFRDVDVAGTGSITLPEFRRLLQRHNLDVGIADAQLRALMRRFPGASTPAGERDPVVPVPGFVEVLLESKTLSAHELNVFMEYIRGVGEQAISAAMEQGVGGMRMIPEVFPHRNRVAAWDANTVDPSKCAGAVSSQSPLRSTMSVARPAAGSPLQATHVPTAGGRAAMVSPPPVPAQTASPVRARDSGVAAAREAASEASSTSARSAAPATSPVQATLLSPAARRAHALRTTLEATENGRALMAMLRRSLAARRTELFQALRLYDTKRSGLLDLQSFVAALGSAGLRLSENQWDVLKLTFADALDNARDAYVPYDAVYDMLFPEATAAGF
jgi:Ca2+-binding EF-hand superfamily protein